MGASCEGQDDDPHPDARFHAWENNIVTYVNGHLADLGRTAGDVVDLNNSAAAWTTLRTAAGAESFSRKEMMMRGTE